MSLEPGTENTNASVRFFEPYLFDLPYCAGYDLRDVPLVVPGQFEGRMPFAAVDLAPISKIMGRKIEAVFGGDLLGHMGIVVNSGRRTVQFGPSGKMTVPPVITPIALANPRPQVEVTIAGKPMLVTIDLGSNSALSLTPEAWARLGLKDVKFKSMPTAHAEGEVHLMDVTQLPEARIGQVTRRNVTVSVRPWPAETGDGVAGVGLFRDADFGLDIKAGKLWLIPRLPSTPAK